ncbi:MAG TPA: molecular chaperone DnaJ [Desulfobacteraceae bacterium]|nr:molecular chaperone DnaJ [Desulfobacteraceae bacterium]
MTKRDYYETLEIPRTAEPAEIKKAYRKLALRYHPDRNPGDKEAESRFKEAAEAYSVLGDPEKKQLYDRFGHAGLEGQGFKGFSGFEDIFSNFGDIFEDFFGFGTRRRGRSRAAQGRSLRYDLEISLEEAFSGKEEKIVFQKYDVCEKCSGTGAAEGSSPEVCRTCQGRGSIARQQGFFHVTTTCPACKGTGRVISNPCRDCMGQGKKRVERKINVRIPPGVDTGSQLRLRGEGEPGENSGPAGDLFVVIHVKDHPFFSRDGENLACRIPVSFVQAALGGVTNVPDLGSENEFELTIPPGTQSGEVLKIPGKGMVSLQNKSRRGTLFVKIHVKIPEKLTARQRELLTAFAETEGDMKDGKKRNKGFLKRMMQ